MENFPPQVIKKVSREVVGLAETPPEGIKIFINDEDITDIQATIEGPGKYDDFRLCTLFAVLYIVLHS